MLSKINTNEGKRIHDDGLQKEKSPLSLPLAGIGLTISLKLGRKPLRVVFDYFNCQDDFLRRPSPRAANNPAASKGKEAGSGT